MLEVLSRSTAMEELYRWSMHAGLRGDFLRHFARRAGGHLSAPAAGSGGERGFWVRMLEREMQNALGRERMPVLLASTTAAGSSSSASSAEDSASVSASTDTTGSVSGDDKVFLFLTPSPSHSETKVLARPLRPRTSELPSKIPMLPPETLP